MHTRISYFFPGQLSTDCSWMRMSEEYSEKWGHFLPFQTCNVHSVANAPGFSIPVRGRAANLSSGPTAHVLQTHSLACVIPSCHHGPDDRRRPPIVGAQS